MRWVSTVLNSAISAQTAYLGGQPEILPLDLGVLDPISDFGLVAVNPRRVYITKMQVSSSVNNQNEFLMKKKLTDVSVPSVDRS